MLHRKSTAFALVALVVALICEPIHARAIRVDSGDWDSSGFLSADSSQAIGFDFSFLGITSSTAQVFTDGRVVLEGGGESLELFPFFEPDQPNVQYEVGTTNASFNEAGLEAGFRVTWLSRDAAGGLVNVFQLSLFELTGNVFALEFNYDAITFGDDDSRIGYANSLGASYDLPGALGLAFAEYMGVGDDDTVDNCPATPNALACNNFYGNSGVFGPSPLVLPDVANGYFRQIDSNGDPVQGRYLFLSAVQVPEPSSLALMVLGALVLVAVRLRSRAVPLRLIVGKRRPRS